MALSKSGKWALGIVGGLFALFVLFWLILLITLVRPSDDGMRISRGANIAIVEVSGIIVDSEETVRQLKRYADNKNVRAIVLRVESPGGGVAASQEIYEEMKRVVEKEKPVIVSMGSVAASGGYYISLPASRIVANPGTITGSIGVISQFIHLNEMLDKVGIDVTTIKSGRYKDSGSMYRSMEKFEEEYWQILMDDVYRQFVDAVSDARGIEEQAAYELAEGKIYTGRQAYERKLIDTLGTYEDAIRIAAEISGIDGEPTIVRERPRRTFWDSFFGAMAGDLSDIRDVLLKLPAVQYRMPDPTGR
jgi:protease IV